MDDLISRADTLKALKKRWEEEKELLREYPQVPHHYYDGNLEAQAVVNSMPSIEPERKKAVWNIQYFLDPSVPSLIFGCSACCKSVRIKLGYEKTMIPTSGFGKYCPWCGAEMDLEDMFSCIYSLRKETD